MNTGKFVANAGIARRGARCCWQRVACCGRRRGDRGMEGGDRIGTTLDACKHSAPPYWPQHASIIGRFFYSSTVYFPRSFSGCPCGPHLPPLPFCNSCFAPGGQSVPTVAGVWRRDRHGKGDQSVCKLALPFSLGETRRINGRISEDTFVFLLFSLSLRVCLSRGKVFCQDPLFLFVGFVGRRWDLTPNHCILRKRGDSGPSLITVTTGELHPSHHRHSPSSSGWTPWPTSSTQGQ